MKHTPTRSMFAVLLALGGLAAVATPASAASPRGESTYQQELAVCGHNRQDRAACIREAGAARQAAARGDLTGAPDYRRNALARCGLQPPAERADCEARVTGAGNTSVEGSVMGGGVIRETETTVTVVPSPPPRPLRAPEPMMRIPEPGIIPPMPVR